MSLTRAGLSVNLPTRSAPIDVSAAFRLGGAAMTAKGSATGAAGNFITLPSGRTQGLWMLQVYNAKMASGDEFYRFFLHGSNDAAFTAGKCDLLGVYDIAATQALRLSQFAGQDTEWPALATGTSAAIYAIRLAVDCDLSSR